MIQGEVRAETLNPKGKSFQHVCKYVLEESHGDMRVKRLNPYVHARPCQILLAVFGEPHEVYGNMHPRYITISSTTFCIQYCV
jgi:hypothetical protein